MTLMQLLIILRARAALVLVVVLTVVGLAAAITLSLPKRYEAEATVVVDPMGADATGGSGPGWSHDNPAATQADIIASYGVALQVVNALDLPHRPAEIRLISGAGPLHWLHVFVAELLPGARSGRRASLRDWLAAQLLAKLHVHTPNDSRVVSVAYTSSDPQFSAKVANAFVHAYLQRVAQVGTDPAQRTAQLFNRQLATLHKHLEHAEARLSKFEQKTGIVSAGQGLDAQNARLADLSAQLVQAESQGYVARAKEERLRRFIRDGGGSSAPADVLDSPAVQQLQQQVVQDQSDLSELARRLGPNHPLYQAAQAKLQRAKQAYREQMLAVAQALLTSAGSTGQEVAALRAEVRRQRHKVLGMKGAHGRLAVLQSEVDNARQAYEAAAKSLAQTQIAGEAAQNASATLLDAATPPLAPAFPKVTVILAAALLAGLALGVGVALWAETLDRRVRSVLDIVELVELPVLAVLGQRARARRQSALLTGPAAPRLER